jgi:biopolymer transport protein ExbD
MQARLLLNGTPFLSLFLILVPLTISAVGPSQGLPIKLAYAVKPGCGDGREVVARVLSNGKVMLNQEENSIDGLEARLKQIYSTTSYRVLFFHAEPDVPIRDVVQVLAMAQRQHITAALVTPKVLREAWTSYCGFEIP